MKVLIIGSQGFIGQHLASHFIKKEWEVNGCDLVDNMSPRYMFHKVSVLSADFETLFASTKFDVCINASGSGNVSFSIDHPISDFESNTIVVTKILDTIRKYQPSCQFLHISSAAVYGNPISLPVQEDNLIAPLSPYGYHKWMSEILCKEYHNLYKLQVAIIRPFSVYGSGLKKQLMWEICSKTKFAKNITLFGTGKESRDFVHINDLVKSISLIIEKGTFDCRIYNIASGSETSIRTIADIFEQEYKHSIKISFSGESRVGDPNNWRADIKKISDLGYSNSMELSEGLAEYIHWFNSNYES